MSLSIKSNLSTLSCGESATILSINGLPIDAADRLRDMGLHRGAKITVLHRTSNWVVSVSGARIGLAKPIIDAVEVSQPTQAM